MVDDSKRKNIVKIDKKMEMRRRTG
jgi:hypothetical protein